MRDIDNNLRLGRFALTMLRQSLRDMDASDPSAKLSAAEWFSTQDDGLVSFSSTCQYLAGYVRSMDPDVVMGYERSAQVREVGTLRHAEHWQALVEASLEDGADARGALCGLLHGLVDPETVPEPHVAPSFTPDRGSSRSGAPGM